jgi:hypothetical protein
MARTLSEARAGFVALMTRETKGPELTRLIAVLDGLIKWSVARPKALGFSDGDSAPAVLAFECVDSKTVCWSVRVTRGDAPKLELYPPTGRSLSPETRAKIVETLNAYSRVAHADANRLRIGFGALKNAAAFEAVTALLGEVLASNTQQVGAAS